ncbi:MAG TPA: hypothetical protein VM925_34225 [Labilithrix sp.]|nr:hypothetical protein [Labilithrix sp.]
MRASFLGTTPFRVVRLLALGCLTTLLFVLLAPGCGRTSLEPESLDQGGVSACGPSTCPDGCCDANGTCRTGSDVRACGSVGGRCSDCVATGFDRCTRSRVCGREDVSCSSATCAGCCAVESGQRLCLSGTEPAACGLSGARCVDCADDGRACDLSTRACGSTRCDATNCDGCCVGDKCLTGTLASACGSSGRQCSTCAAGQQCRAVTGGGGRCEGTSTCGPQNCGGCCNAAGRCVTGNDTTACGKQGEACDACALDEVCVPDGVPNARTCQKQPTCGPGNCSGCCVGNQCVLSPTPTACGAKGAACKGCAANQVCSAQGTCVSADVCSPATCAGCCVGDVCAVGTQQTACGAGGGLCQNCANQSPARVCQSGACQLPTCGPATCPNGCCSGNTCVVGTQDNACGPIGGGACTDCSASNETCQARQCQTKCGPANCAGCCRANNTCNALGIDNNACGQGGAACVNCTSSGSFCSGLVSPRRCNNQQNTCPATYGTCAAGIRTPVTAPLQNVCSDTSLDALATSCGGGPDTTTCVAAFAALTSSCRTCLDRFNHPFDQKTGLFACAASSVNSQCRRAMGCATDCAQTSCSQCAATSESQCYSLVNDGNGQCSAFDDATSCANGALAGGLCSQYSYANFGAWLRSVGDAFCGNGP